MGTTIIILSCIVLYLVITKFMQRSEIKNLRYRLHHKHRKVNELVVDSTNKIMIFHLENATITPVLRDKISNDFQDTKKRILRNSLR